MWTHHSNSNLWRGVAKTFTWTLCLLLAATAGAVTIEETDFNDQTDQGWQGFGVRPPGPQLVAPGPSGDPGDFYYRVVDRASVGNIPGLNILAPPSFNGDYSTVADTCGSLEFDLRVFDDQGGDLSLQLNFASDPDGFLQGADPQIRARFRVSDTIDESDGWVHVTVPLTRLDNGMLPSNAQGAWEMTGSSTASQWNALLASVDQVYIPLEINTGTFETVGIDNFRLVSGECPCPTEPNWSQRAGLADEFAAPSDPVRRVGFGGLQPAVGWKAFDDTRINRWLGHTFDSLPTDVIGGELEIRMQPELFGNSSNDAVALGFDGTSFLYSELIADLPEAGGNGPTTFVIPLSQAVLDRIASTGRLELRVQDDTTVDHAVLRLIRCPAPKRTSGTLLSFGFTTGMVPNLDGSWDLVRFDESIEVDVETRELQGNCIGFRDLCLNGDKILALAAKGPINGADGSTKIGSLTLAPTGGGVGFTSAFEPPTSVTSTEVKLDGQFVTIDYSENGLVAIVPDDVCVIEADFMYGRCFRIVFSEAVEIFLPNVPETVVGNEILVCMDIIVGAPPHRQAGRIQPHRFGLRGDSDDPGLCPTVRRAQPCTG